MLPVLPMLPMLPRLFAVVVLGGAVAVGSAAVPSGAAGAAAKPRCDGQVATIVGKGPTINGTAGDDVIVARGATAQSVDGRAGDDVICLGEGNDVGKGGPGDDRILGGAGGDLIEDLDGSNRLLGGDGADWIVGKAKGGTHADLRGGAGHDNIGVTVRPGGTLALDGAGGRDHVDLELQGGPDGQAVVLDRGAGTLVVGTEQVATLGDAETYYLFGDHLWTYLGVDATDRVGAMQGTFDISLGAGDDQVISLTGATDHTDGGPGEDTGFFSETGTHTCLDVEVVAQGTCLAPID